MRFIIDGGMRDWQELAVAELEAIPSKSDRELLDSIAEILVVMELQLRAKGE